MIALEVDSVRRNLGGLAIEIELQPFPFPPRLEGNTVFAHTRRDRGVILTQAVRPVYGSGTGFAVATGVWRTCTSIRSRHAGA